MQKNIKLLDLNIDKLMKISNTIKYIYDQIASLNTNDQKKKELYKTLSLAIKTENNIYKEILNNFPINNQFFNRLEYLIFNSDIENKEQICSRIEAYLTYKEYVNPYPSTSLDKDERKHENIITIKCSTNIDYLTKLYYFLQNAQTTTTSEKSLVENAKNTLLFEYKILNDIIGTSKYPNFNGKERCLIFKHDELLVNNIYLNYALPIIDKTIIDLLSKNNLLSQITLHSALTLLELSEISQIAQKYQENALTIPFFQMLTKENPNHQLIIEIFSQYMEEEKKKSSK